MLFVMGGWVWVEVDYPQLAVGRWRCLAIAFSAAMQRGGPGYNPFRRW